VRRIAPLARQAYEVTLSHHRRGMKKFNEEAHLLSYVYPFAGYPTDRAKPYVKRIWTNRDNFSNVDGTESQLVLWHLPAEKKRGFIEAFISYRQVAGQYVTKPANYAKYFSIQEPFRDKCRYFCRYVKKRIRKILAN